MPYNFMKYLARSPAIEPIKIDTFVMMPSYETRYTIHV